MPLNILKLCVGVTEIEELESWVKDCKAGRDTLDHVTRMFPKRGDEILPGGSLYWVIRGMILCRQPIAALEAVKGQTASSAAGSCSSRRSSRCGRCRSAPSRAGAILKRPTRRRPAADHEGRRHAGKDAAGPGGAGAAVTARLRSPSPWPTCSATHRSALEDMGGRNTSGHGECGEYGVRLTPECCR